MLLLDSSGDLLSIFVTLGRNENPISQCLCDVCNLKFVDRDDMFIEILIGGRGIFDERETNRLRSLTHPSDVG